MDNMVINALMRVVIQSNENCLYCIALDTNKAFGENSISNIDNLLAAKIAETYASLET